MLETLSWLSIFCTVMIPVLNLDFFRRRELSERLFIALAVEHVLVLLRGFIYLNTTNMPRETKLMLARRQAVVDRVLHQGQAERKPVRQYPAVEYDHPDRVELLPRRLSTDSTGLSGETAA